MPVDGLESYAVVTIDEVDLPNRLAHVSDKTGGQFQVSFRNSPAGILYVPAQGESWVVVKIGVFWYLDTKLDDLSDQAWAEENLKPGDIRIKGGNIHFEGIVHGADGIVTLIYSTTVTTDASLGNGFTITANNGVAFTISSPMNPTTGQRITYTVRNTSGGALGAITWGIAFRLSTWTSPATANSRSITFRYDGTNWVEVGRTPADVPN